MIALLPARHACNNGFSCLDLDWCPPESKGQLGQWGSSLRDWCLVFHFWTHWRNAEPGTDHRNWSRSEVTALFLPQGGLHADFCTGCGTWAQLIWKLHVLSVKLLNDCLHRADLDGPLHDNDVLEKWHISLPQERMLCASFTCDMTPAGASILDMLDTIMARISIDRPRITRKWVVEMSEVWRKLLAVCSCHLQE